MKITRLELAAGLLTAVFLAFGAGWFLGGSRSAPPVRVETSRVLEQREPVVLTPPAETPVGKININTADEAELRRLPGIGEKRARDIIKERTENGPFRIPEDLARVSGIGEGTLDSLMELITTGEEIP